MSGRCASAPLRVGLLALALAGASATATLASPTTSPKALVLRARDLPPGYKVDTERALSLTEAAREAWGAPTLRRWGYVQGYEVTYKIGNSLKAVLTQPAGIDSAVSVYRSASGAHASLAASAALCRTPPNSLLASPARIGDETYLCFRQHKESGATSVVYGVIWRKGRLKAGVQIAGFQGATTAALAIRLAKKQDARFP